MTFEKLFKQVGEALQAAEVVVQDCDQMGSTPPVGLRNLRRKLKVLGYLKPAAQPDDSPDWGEPFTCGNVGQFNPDAMEW